jgi:hypothetical protein
MSRFSLSVTGLFLGMAGTCMAESYACPKLLSDLQAAEGGALSVWQLVDPAIAPGTGGLMAVEVFDGPPTQLFQLAPEVTTTADGSTDVYDLTTVEQAFIRCRYTGVDLQLVMAAEPSLSRCEVALKDGVFQPAVVCE